MWSGEGLLGAKQLVVEAGQRLLYWAYRGRRLLWPGGFVRRQVEDGPRHGVEGRGWNVRRFGQLGWRMGALAEVLSMARVGRREAAPAASREHLTVTRLVLFPPALSLILPRPRVPGLRPRHLLRSSVLTAATTAPAAAAAVAGLHLTVLRVRPAVVQRPGGLT